MKKIFLYFICIILLLIFWGGISKITGQVKLSSFGINAGWYNPSFDYWVKSSSVSNWDEKFGGSVIAGINLQFRIMDLINLRIGADYWKQSVEQKDILVGSNYENEKLSIRLIPINVDLIYKMHLTGFCQITPYFGAGGKIFFIEKKFTRSPVDAQAIEDTDNGWCFAGNIFAGFEKQIFCNLNAGIEISYILGEYTQQEKNIGEEISDHKVSISGFNIMATINYAVNFCFLDF